MNWKSLLKFVLLTVWVVFVSTTANQFFKPDIFKQTNAIHSCLNEIKKVDIKDFNKNNVGLIVDMNVTNANISFINLDSSKNIDCLVFLKDMKVSFIMQGLKTYWVK